MSEFLEFLTENSQRKYPLLEDCVPNNSWPDDVILDARGFTRANATGGVFFLAYSGATSIGDPEWEAPAGNSSLFFGLGLETVARIDVPTIQQVFPFTAQATVIDPLTSAPLAGIKVVIGQAWLDLSPSDQFLMGVTAPLENSTIFDLHRQQVDVVGILHTNGNTELFDRDIVIRGGYNTEVTQKDSEIFINAIPGHGELGEYPGDGPGDECRDLVYSISGVRPDNAGKLKFTSGHGVEIVSLANTIQITLSTDGLSPIGAC